MASDLQNAAFRDDDKAREVAEWIEREHPRWIVVFGAFTKQFICFPRFPAAPGTVVVASYPGALPARMKYAERVCQLAPRQLESRERHA